MHKPFVAIIAALVCGVSASVEAHHSFAAQYDANKPITLRGTITRMLWSNPHGHLYIDVRTADGKTLTWELETGAPAALYRRGWRREDLPVGAEVVVRGYLARDGTTTANATTVTLVATGKELFAGSSAAGEDGATVR
ncbi:MAG: hypothetical protein A3I61_08255 [Acidobacteria bacterium RIFCSPLOWO2_02_FULL_68_18]|nr:MAG: hypothetical protein A3I61_08255 [Acidobacteria bacterium RIFCSPLOWO2_02_FULL_68_18]OFW51232.1 MAG: hypothetical protein A3G77_06350 [Acidobacteria bacterium RIFCSPLOWO2_12_FULL_68_19]